MGNSPMEGVRECAAISNFYSRVTWIEGRAEDQLKQVATWPGMKKVAGFPDLHPGRFGPVGAAFLADRIYPQLIGPDIGCGMALFLLDIPARKLKADKAARRLRVLENGATEDRAAEALCEAGLEGTLPSRALGTIGGGNHFCEVQSVKEVFDPGLSKMLDLSEGDMCLLVHSGSRGHGFQIFNDLEQDWNEGFQHESEAAKRYLDGHDAAKRWARVNRLLIAEIAAAALRADLKLICDASHNHLVEQDGLWVHHKGAAQPDQGLAPLAGSRDSLSYLVSAENGPAEALGALSHGSGRKYDRSSMHGRIQKTKTSLSSLERNRFGGTIICEDRDLLLEEAGCAYKDPASVLKDLVSFGVASPVMSLSPMITYKTTRNGDSQ